MFYTLITFVSFVCVVLAAVCGYLYATIKTQRSSGTLAPVPVPDVAVKVAEPVNDPESPKPIKTPSPKSSPKAAPRKTEGKNDALPLPEGAPAKPVRSNYPDTEEGLASYKYDIHQYWNKVTALRRKMAKSGTATNAKPKAETKPEPIENKPEQKAKPEPKKATKKTTNPKAEVVETPKAETTETPKDSVSVPVTNHTKAELLEAIKQYKDAIIEKADIKVKFGKQECTIFAIRSTVAALTDGREVQLSSVPFSRAILENIIVACNAVKAKDEKPAEKPAADPKAEEPKPEIKKNPKDVQPLTDAERYAQNTASGIVTTLNNRNIQSVTFVDSIISVFTDPKTKKAVDVEITGLRRTDKGDVYVTFAMANNKVGRFELIKGAYVFNYETLRTIQKQVNEGAAKKRNANATIEYIKTVA